jgi:broad-specificity NMP kinase
MKEAEGMLRLDERLRNWASADRVWSDAVDAARIEQAWPHLEPHHRELLRMVFVWRANRGVICRRLKIPGWPPQKFELKVAEAKSALARLLRDKEV